MGDKSRGVIIKSLLLVSFICFCGIIISFFFPGFTINLLFGEIYLGLSGILLYVVSAFAMLSILNVIILYRISREEFKLKAFVSLLMLFIIQLAVLIYFGNDVRNFSLAMFFSSLISLIGGLLLIKK